MIRLDSAVLAPTTPMLHAGPSGLTSIVANVTANYLFCELIYSLCRFHFLFFSICLKTLIFEEHLKTLLSFKLIANLQNFGENRYGPKCRISVAERLCTVTKAQRWFCKVLCCVVCFSKGLVYFVASNISIYEHSTNSRCDQVGFKLYSTDFWFCVSL